MKRAKVFGMAVRVLLLWFVFLLSMATHAQASESESRDNAQVMQAFTAQEAKQTGVLAVEDQKKRLVMFLLGVPLLILILLTGALGVAMGIYGKQVYVAHMLLAGLTVTLAIAHAIVGLVWFYPF